MKRSEEQQMRVKERCSSPRMPLPLWKLGVRERKESGEIETGAGAEERKKEGGRISWGASQAKNQNVLKHQKKSRN